MKLQSSTVNIADKAHGLWHQPVNDTARVEWMSLYVVTEGQDRLTKLSWLQD